MKIAIRDDLASGCMEEYSLRSQIYADWLEEHGDQAGAERRRWKARTVRSPGNGWPKPGLLPSLTPHQVRELRAALARPFGLLVGTPGTGKTFATGVVVAELCDRVGPESIAVCAPTGKAAVRITDALAAHGAPVRARTIHSLLEIGRNGHDGKGWGFQRNGKNPLAQRYVIVDEASMLDTSLAASLLEACRPGTHVLLVGDPHQLPPVGHGAPLRDLIAAGVPCGTLTEVQRNAGMIVEACARIKGGSPFEVAGGYERPGNLEVIERERPEAQAEALGSLMSELVARSGEGLDPVWDVQVLVAVNKNGLLSRDSVNRQLQGVLNPDGERADGNPFRVGDKVICLRNGMYPRAAVAEEGRVLGDPEEHWLANGEIGRVIAVDARQLVAMFASPDRRVRIPVGRTSSHDEDEAGASSNFELAYGITVHKSQGSEWPIVIVLVDASPGAARIAGREWLYTAVSRARKHCYLVGRLAVACQMARRPMLENRKTFLRELLTENRL